MKLTGSILLDAKGRVVLAPSGIDGKVDEDAQLLQQIVCRTRPIGPPSNDGLNMLTGHFTNKAMSYDLLFAEAHDIAVRLLRRWCEALVVWAGKVLVHELIKAALGFWGRSVRGPYLLAQNCLVGVHKQTGKRNPFALAAAVVVVPLAMPIDERVDLFELDLCRLKSVQLLEFLVSGKSTSLSSRGRALKARSTSSMSQTLRLPMRRGFGMSPSASSLRKNVGESES